MLFHGRGDPRAPCVHHWHHEKGLGTAEIYRKYSVRNWKKWISKVLSLELSKVPSRPLLPLLELCSLLPQKALRFQGFRSLRLKGWSGSPQSPAILSPEHVPLYHDPYHIRHAYIQESKYPHQATMSSSRDYCRATNSHGHFCKWHSQWIRQKTWIKVL